MGFFDKIPLVRSFRRRERNNAEEIRTMLAARYRNFKILLSANNEAHELFAELEETLRGGHPYGMHYVRALCTKISASIFQMVRHLNELSPGAYEPLFQRFREIQQKINPHLSPPQVERGGPLVMPFSEVRREHLNLCGSKMSKLCEAASALETPSPPGFVVTAEAYRRFITDSGLKEEIDRRVQSTEHDATDAALRASSSIMQLIIDAPLPPELEQAIMDAYREVERLSGAGTHMAVRSSALGEDSGGTAFAGQYRSILNVDAEDLVFAYKEVVASKWSVEAWAYRVNRGIRDEDVAMCVGFMAMVDARSSGVAYSASPVDFSDERVRIYSVWGLPKPVVDGAAATDEFRVARNPETIESARIAYKKGRYCCLPNGDACHFALNEDLAEKTSVSDEQVLAVARLAVDLERYFGHPQDVEWAFDQEGRLLLLQCRPLMESERQASPPLPEGLPEPLFSEGMTASPGVAAGPAYVIRKDADALAFPTGAVLVLRQALPRRASLLNRAAAVLAEQGGAAGHLANVAREFGVPAVFGMQGLLETLENGMQVTVDADFGTVYAGHLQPLLARKRQRRDLMRGSPVRAALVGAARHILRLRLLNPDSPDFKARNCRTFHDIMRFCHEKAVQEMFHFGMNRVVQRAAVRQLICDVPKQFWVLNLDDAFTPDGQDRADGCVLMGQIRSIPMRAIWQGMMAFPWDGPPPVNARGFLSVMFEATANPNLNLGTNSDYTSRNYFMVSRSYCALQSRFGFHFCGSEAYIGKRPAENYASFQFKGGAADLYRRILRTRFIADFLEEHDFRVKLREDSLFARVEGLEQPEMERRLKIIGYLITHTRQIDMVMTDPQTVQQKRTAISNALKELSS